MGAILRKRFTVETDFWSVSTFLLALLILTPLLVVMIGSVLPDAVSAGSDMRDAASVGPDSAEPVSEWPHILQTVLLSYITNTLIVVASVLFLSLLMGLPTAWLVAVFDFPGRRFFEWVLILPLAIPTYVAAFVYTDVIEMTSGFQLWVRNNYSLDTRLKVEAIIRYGLLSLLMASVLYPYLFISARASFSRQQRSVIEAAQLMGRRPGSIFRTIALPLARPAIVAGLSLIIMEVVNDYGAVQFFGVQTLTPGIFRTWFNLEDRDSAVRLAGIVMVFVLTILLVEYLQRGRARFAEDSTDSRPLARRELSRGKSFAAIAVCLFPFFFGFVFPVTKLVIWTSKVGGIDFRDSLEELWNTVLLASSTAAAMTVVALIFAYAWKLHKVSWLRGISRLATLGYAVPGAVVALGVMICLGWTDQQSGRLGEAFGGSFVLLSGSLFAIGFAYVVRFLAVAFHPLHAGTERVCGSLDEASRTLGKSPTVTLFRINIPLLRGTILAALTLVFIDILKELPLTLILRPANFDTLAIEAFGKAKEGEIYNCAPPSLLIIAIGALGLILINRFMKSEVQ